MGCAQSRIENEESVSRCKERKILMKEAVVARNAFAAGHSGFAVGLKNTGAALSDYALGESEEAPQLHHPNHHHHQQALEAASEPQPPPPPPLDNLPPPPPPLPNFSPIPQLKRATTMPEIPTKFRKPGSQDAIAEEDEEEEEEDEERSQVIHRARRARNRAQEAVAAASSSSSLPRTPEMMKAVPPMPEVKGMGWDYFFNMENMPGSSLGAEEENGVGNDENETTDFDEEAENVEDGGGVVMDEVEPKTPEKMEEKPVETEVPKPIQHSHTAPVDIRRVGKVAPTVSLTQILNQLDDHFLKASEGAQEVSKMLEATRLHYHSNFADNRGSFSSSLAVPYLDFSYS